MTAMVAAHGASNALFIAELIALLGVGGLLGELMQRLGQPAVMGQLLAGILLGPSVFGALYPTLQHALFPDTAIQRSMIEGVGELGILLLLLITGMETDLAAVSKVRRPALAASLFGILVPFAAGFTLGEWLPETLLPNPNARLITALFCGIALSISSVKIVAVIVRNMHFEHRRVGQVLLAAAILDDTVGWVLLAAVLGLAKRGQIDGRSVMHTVTGTLLFLALSFTLGRRAVSLLIRVTNDYLRVDMAVITVILIVMGLFALVTNALGVHTVLGAFVAGMLVGRSPILTRHIQEQLRGLISALFMPVFFGLAGLTADLSILRQPALLGWAAAFILAASVGKFTGSFIGGRVGQLSARESLALGCGLNARGSTEVIVASLGLAVGALNGTLFTLIVGMALVTTLAMPSMLRWSLARVPMTQAEAERLERVAFEGRGYVPNLERLLAAVDQSASGKLAARCVGLLAGAWGMPTTVVPLVAQTASGIERGAPEAAAVEVGRAAAVPPQADAARPAGAIQIVAPMRPGDSQAGIAEVSKRGFDLLWVGSDPGADASGVVSPHVSDIASAFHGHAALVFARGQLAQNPGSNALRVLVAVTGTAHSRRAAEVALSLAQASHGSVTALLVSTAPSRKEWSRTLNLTQALRGGEEAVLREITDLAEQYGTRVETLLRSGGDPAQAILEELGRGPYTVVILGVTRRPGESLSLGATARVVLAHSPQSVILHAS